MPITRRAFLASSVAVAAVGFVAAKAASSPFLKASIEYPAGVFTPLTFGGKDAAVWMGPQMTEAQLNALTSDPIKPIPAGDLFSLRTFWSDGKDSYMSSVPQRARVAISRLTIAAQCWHIPS